MNQAGGDDAMPRRNVGPPLRRDSWRRQGLSLGNCYAWFSCELLLGGRGGRMFFWLRQRVLQCFQVAVGAWSWPFAALTDEDVASIIEGECELVVGEAFEVDEFGREEEVPWFPAYDMVLLVLLHARGRHEPFGRSAKATLTASAMTMLAWRRTS
jgi:hypothetical protein